jgi:chemotaxis protein MotB
MLYIHPRREPAPKTTPSPSPRPTSLPEPWPTGEADESADGNNWLLSYADLITLLFALFVVLCAHQKIVLDQRVQPEKTAQVAAPLPQPAETTPAPSAPVAPPVEVLSQPASTPRNDVIPTVQLAHVPVAPALPPQWLAMPQPEPVAAPSPPLSVSARLPQAELDRWVEFSASEQKVRLEVNDKILFDPASAKLKPDGILVLDSLAHWLKLQAGQVDVEGHTDNSPINNLKFDSNWELSTARASTVTRYLIGQGLAPERVKAIGLADTQPRTGNDTPDGRARNRRVSLVLYLLRQDGVAL